MNPKTKKCSKCLIEKEDNKENFYSYHKGDKKKLITSCKDCRRKQTAIQKRLTYDDKKEREKYLKRKQKGLHILNADKMASLYPQKHKARYELRNAVAAGKVIKTACEKCGNTKSEAHHEDYNKPFDVRWLCRKCHGAEHRKY